MRAVSRDGAGRKIGRHISYTSRPVPSTTEFPAHFFLSAESWLGEKPPNSPSPPGWCNLVLIGSGDKGWPVTPSQP